MIGFFALLIGLAVLVGTVSCLSKCLQAQKSWSKSPPLCGEAERGTDAQLGKFSGLWRRQEG